MTTITIERSLLEQALNALLLPCDRWNKQQFLIVKGAIESLNAALVAPATAPEPVACLVETDGGAMVWPIDDIDEAGTYCEPDEFPILLYRATAPDELEQLRKDSERMREALMFYAEGDHFTFDRDAWDTVSDEPQNYWCDEAGTATVEDGTIAKLALDAAMKGTP